MKTIIPQQPKTLFLKLNHLWNGDVCPDDRLWAEVSLSKVAEGVLVYVRGPMLYEQQIPDSPIGERVDGLWEFDVIEVFFVGPGHQYLELELGAGGHWLALGFDRIRHRSHEYKNFNPIVRYEKRSDKTWSSRIVLPWRMIPENLRALNACAIMAGQCLSLTPLSGEKPDFHQPDSFSSVSI
jgi:hypothetical protein